MVSRDQRQKNWKEKYLSGVNTFVVSAHVCRPALVGSSFAFLELLICLWPSGPLKEKNTHSSLLSEERGPVPLSQELIETFVLEQETFSCGLFHLLVLWTNQWAGKYFPLLVIERAASVIGAAEPFISFHVYHLCSGPGSGAWPSASHFVNQRSKFLTLFWISSHVYLKIVQSLNCQLNRQCGKSFWNLPGLPCCGGCFLLCLLK